MISEKMYLTNTMEQQSTERILNLQDETISIFSLSHKSPYALLRGKINFYSMTIKDYVGLQFDLKKDEHGNMHAKDGEDGNMPKPVYTNKGNQQTT